MAAPESVQSERVEFMRKEGFLIATEANDGLLDAVSKLHISRINDPRAPEGRDYYENMGASLALSAATRHIIREVIGSEADPAKVKKRVKATLQEERAVAQYTMVGDIADQEFPWHFSAGVASSVVHEFVEAGMLSQEEYDSLSLTDWAHMISSGWFSKLIHSMAFTGNGVWAKFGDNYHSHCPGALLDKISCRLELSSIDRVYDLQEEYEPVEDRLYMTAKLKPEIRGALRKDMKEQYLGSTGCPAARLACKVSFQDATSARVKRLVANGLLIVENESRNRAILRQEMTAIDRTLIFFANQLAQYDQAYGTPGYTPTEEDASKYTWSGHASIPMTGAFSGRPRNNTLSETE